MKRLSLAVALLFAGFQAACSGGGGNGTIPPPPPVGFSNSSLSGQYAFTMVGNDPLGNPIARVGVFVADGHGGIQGGIEDVDVGLGDETLTFNAGTTYSISSDGRGTINLANSTTVTQPLIFSVTLTSPTQGFIVQTDGNATTSGTFNLQNTNAFTPASLSASYVFDFAGISPDQSQQFFLPDSLIGQFTLNNGALQSGVLDENFAAQLSGPLAFSATNGITFDNANAQFGRGTLNFTAGGTQFSYVFYVVDGNRLHLMEINSASLTVGDAIRQTAAPANNAGFTGSFAYLLAGAGGTGPDTRVGRFTADGNGGLPAASIAQDENNDGSIFAVPNGTLSATTYAVDPTFPGSGRVTITFNDSNLSKNGAYSFIAYMASGTQGFLQDVENGFVLDGQILAQTGGPFSTSGVAGDYAFNYTGLGINNSTGAAGEEDFVGHVTITSAGSASGAMDFNAFSSNNGVFPNVGVSGTLTLGGDGTTSTGTRNTLSLKTNNSPSTTYPFIAYVVNANTVFILSTHQDHVDAGSMIRQAP